MHLRTPIAAVLRTRKEYIAALEEIDIKTIEDLLLYLPRTYEDRSEIVEIETAPLGEKITIRGVIIEIAPIRTRSKMSVIRGKIVDDAGGVLHCVWFNQPHLLRMYKVGSPVAATGKVEMDGKKRTINSPQLEAGDRPMLLHAGRIVPTYPQHSILNSMWFREKIALVAEVIEQIPETLPSELIQEQQLLSRSEAIRELHFPTTPEALENARKRLRFEQLFAFQVEALVRKQEWQGSRDKRLMMKMQPELVKAFFASLGFTPTEGQRIAIYEILRDMERDLPMSRLLEGDVGSGKTLVATACMLHVVAHGGQAAFLVPTEVLAQQHATTLQKLLLQFAQSEAGSKLVGRPPRVVLLTGSTGPERRSILDAAATGTLDILVGTHALLEEKVQFRNLLLAIVDEQHRFGVKQRETLKDKGNPHFLAMTATPIPRTLALTAFGHHDLSVLLEKPAKRGERKTHVVAPGQRKEVEAHLLDEIHSGRQAYVICPTIDGSEEGELQDIAAVEQEVERLRAELPKDVRIASLHGKMQPRQKQQIMDSFRRHECDVLVSTTVVEVGVDVPNATLMVVEAAERFGLAQLHQLRGRIGRGEHESTCYLMASTKDLAHSPRLKAMEQHDSGFLLAEIDLQLRGPGELYGLRQSGVPAGVLEGMMHPELVVAARKAAEQFGKTVGALKASVVG